MFLKCNYLIFKYYFLILFNHSNVTKCSHSIPSPKKPKETPARLEFLWQQQIL